ncbi:MAG TPA: hypothetical protein VKR41_04055, partial [Puia sp.]|nr:hypothetical protein [Puia sp.]
VNLNDSTDTVFHPKQYDSAKFYVSYFMDAFNTSGVYNDTFADDASMIIYVVNGVVNVPLDSILNNPPSVWPSSGSSGGWSATWIPDNIGEINIASASGEVLSDTEVVIWLVQQGTVSPKWSISFDGGAPTVGGGEPNIGWPLVYYFNPTVKSQYPINLLEPAGDFDVWVSKDY